MLELVLSLLVMTIAGGLMGYSVGYVNGREFEIRKQIEAEKAAESVEG